MKFKVVTLLLAALLALPAVAAPPSRRATTKSTSALDTDKFINANKVLMFINNEANFAYDAAQSFGKYDGLYYPYSSVDDIINGANDKTVIYDAGMWMGAIDSATGDLLVTVAEYSTSYEPGNMVAGGPNPSPNDPVYRIYKLYSDSMASNPNSDYLNWPVDQGAPVDDSGHPAIIGDQMAWTVYNDANSAKHTNDAGTVAPLGVEIQQSAFAFNREDAMGNIVFLKFKVINKGSMTLQSMYLSLWSDPDLGGASDDLVGCDSSLSLGYCYNATNADSKYGSAPPAVGFDFFQGPLDSTGNPDDTGRMWGQKYPGNVNQPMSSFNKYINGTDPSSPIHTYNYMQGLNRDGTPYTYLGNVSTYFVSGDPVTRTGDLDFNPSDRRFMLTTGPFTLRPGDSTEVLAAIIAGIACDRLTSIDALKYYDRFAQTAYELDFDLPAAPRAPQVTVVQDDEIVGLSWTNLSEVDHGDYPFEGYTVLQGTTATGPWKKIPNATWDISNGIGVIYDEEFDIANCGVLNKPLKFGSDPGVRRWFSADADYINGGPLHDASEYFFRVEAYSYDPSQTPKTLTSATVLKVIPQRNIPEKSLPLVLDNIIPANHVGISDGSVLPQVIDPNQLTGDTYRVTFAIDTAARFYIDTLIEDTAINVLDTLYDTVFVGDTTQTDTVLIIRSIRYDTLRDTTISNVYDSTYTVIWNLRNMTDTVDVLTRQFNQGATADAREDYTIVDGMMVRVYGPPPGYKGGEPGDADEGWNVPSGSRRWSQASADGLHLEGFRGAAGWSSGPNAFFVDQGVGADRMRNLEFRLALTDSVGNFNASDSNVSYGYRYMRRAVDPPQQPSFGPYIINATGGYAYQAFEQNVPLSVWNIDTTGTNPAVRLAVGFLENNVPGGTVDGRYWPPYNGDYENVGSAGPREWLFVFDTAYSTTADPTFQVDFLNAAYLPTLLHATWSGRNDPNGGAAAFQPGDRFRMLANHINYVTDTFTFVAVAPSLATTGASVLENVKAVPNPYYLFSSYDRSVLAHRMQFTNLPAKCTISIFTLAGDRIAIVTKDDPTTSLADWDLLTENRIPLASGIYIYVVDAPGFGQKIGKMAIFTEQEQLDTY